MDIDPDTALPTLYAAKKYILPRLEKACRNIVIQNLGPDNIWTVYASTFNIPDDELTEGCKRFFGSNTTAVAAALISPKFLEISDFLLKSVLELNHSVDDEGKRTYGVLVPEIQLFKACNEWAVAECSRQELEPSGENKRKVLGECVELIRCVAMLPIDIIRSVIPSGIFDQNERCRLLAMANLHQVFGARANAKGDQFSYFIPLQPESIAVGHVEEYSAIHRRYTEYSNITVRANHNLMLTGIVLFVHQSDDLQSKHEVCIEGKTEEKTWSRVITATTTSGVAYERKLLSCVIDGMQLKANCEYEIKVEQTGCVPCPASSFTALAKGSERSHSIKLARQVGLDILNSANNECMVCLACRLV